MERYKHIFLRESFPSIEEISDILETDSYQLAPLSSHHISSKQKRSQRKYVDRVRYMMEELFELQMDSSSEVLVDRVFRGVCFYKVCDFPLYLCGDISEKDFNRPLKMRPFKEYIMVNCLFGSHLKGVLSCGKETICINHSLENSIRFESLVVDDRDHPYEVTMWECFKILSSRLDLKRIRYHLPKEDYILFGLHLLENEIIDLNLYEYYVNQVHKRAQRHMNVIQSLHSNVEFTSPFSGLTMSPDKDLNHYINDVLSSKDGEIWSQVMQAVGTPTSFDAFLKLGNLVFVAQSSVKHHPLEVCALYPSSERTILHQYAKHLDGLFPSISSIVWLPPVTGWPTLFEAPSTDKLNTAFDYWYR